MKLIKPSVELIKQSSGIEGVYKIIEKVGRTCYKSEDKITEDSAKPFVDRMIKSQHWAMLEHGTVYLTFHVKDPSEVGEEEYCKQQRELNELIDRYANNKFSIAKVNHYYDTAFITTNLRVLVENNWMDDLQYLCEPTSLHEERITIKMVCDRGVSHEFVRHRVFSFAQESTRYCNYSKDKFDNELTFIQPCCLEDDGLALYGPFHTIKRESSEGIFITNLNNAEKDYLALIWLGWTPQQARAILPNALKTELVMTGLASDWKHFFDLRYRGTTGAPHPDAKKVATLAHDVIKKELNVEL